MVRIQRFLVAVLSLFTAALLSGCDQRSAASSDAQFEPNGKLVRRWIEVGFNERRVAIVDEVFRDSVAINGLVIPRDGLKQSMNQHFAGFPDLRVTITTIIDDGERVGVWYTAEGTHKGSFDGLAATGKRVTWKGVDLFILERGRVSEASFLSELPMQLRAGAK